MKKIFFLAVFLFLSLASYCQVINLDPATSGNIDTSKVAMKSDTSTFLATKYELATAVGIDYPGAGIPLSTGSAWGASITNNSGKWDTAYTDRLKWDGGATALVAATGRTSLGATTVGAAFFMLTNPGAVTFPRINADNSITTLSAANFKTALSLTSTDVGLNNVTNKAQVELEDSALMAGGYFSYSDGIAGLALKLNKADSGVWAGGYVTPKDLDDAVLGLTDTVSLETIVTLQADTVPLFVFGTGGGNEADTALFTTSTLYGSFFNKGSDSLIITELRAVMLAGTTPLGTDTLSVQVYWNDTINKTGVSSVSINTNPLGINSVTVGTVDASFNNSTIPPNVWVFCKTPGVVTGRKPNYLSITLSGHKQNRAF